MNRIVRPPSRVSRSRARGDGRPDVGDAAHHRRERDEPGVDRIGEEPGEARLAGSRRTPQEERREVAALDRPAQRPALAHEVVLADELLEAPRPHPGRERLSPRRRLEQDDLVGRRLATRHRASLGQATLVLGVQP